MEALEAREDSGSNSNLNQRLSEIAEQLKKGLRVQSPTVREFLSWISASRRGYWIVDRIRGALEISGLETEPDFESAYLDSWITFKLSEGKSAVMSQGNLAGIAAGTSTATGTLDAIRASAQSDPTYRISKLAAANKPPVSIKPEATLQEAVTLMMSNDFSQLPVMTGERDVKGLISWNSIGSRLALGKTSNVVRDLMDQHQEIRSDASLFEAIGVIVQNQYVLIRGSDNRINGIVTSSDLSLQFQQLAEPFLLLGEIENHVRKVISNHFSVEQLAEVRDCSDSARMINGVADLTFGEYIRLLENPDNWSKLHIDVDRRAFVSLLDRVRTIRNDVMHFDPDGIPEADLEALRDFVHFLQRLHTLGVT